MDFFIEFQLCWCCCFLHFRIESPLSLSSSARVTSGSRSITSSSYCSISSGGGLRREKLCLCRVGRCLDPRDRRLFRLPSSSPSSSSSFSFDQLPDQTARQQRPGVHPRVVGVEDPRGVLAAHGDQQRRPSRVEFQIGCQVVHFPSERRPAVAGGRMGRELSRGDLSRWRDCFLFCSGRGRGRGRGRGERGFFCLRDYQRERKNSKIFSKKEKKTLSLFTVPLPAAPKPLHLRVALLQGDLSPAASLGQRRWRLLLLFRRMKRTRG